MKRIFLFGAAGAMLAPTALAQSLSTAEFVNKVAQSDLLEIQASEFIATNAMAMAQEQDHGAPTPTLGNAPDRLSTGGPRPGANSFTEGQAKSRIESHGYANVLDLVKDGQGIWRGRAMKDGKSVQVSLDYQGNVFVQ